MPEGRYFNLKETKTRQPFTAQGLRRRSCPLPSYLLKPPQPTNRTHIGMGSAWLSGTLEASAPVQGQPIFFSRQNRMASKPAAALGAAGRPSQHQRLSNGPSAAGSAIGQTGGDVPAVVLMRPIGNDFAVVATHPAHHCTFSQSNRGFDQLKQHSKNIERI